MPKYEYEIINRDQAERVEWVGDLFNEMGSNGWKLCVVSDWFFGFERQVPEYTPPPHVS